MTYFQIYFAAFVPLLILIVTCIARVNDIGRSREFRWHVRRLGFTLVGAASCWFILSPLGNFQYVGETALAFLAGHSMVWVTTPNMPPWWRYITGEFRLAKAPAPDDEKTVFDKTAGRKTGAVPIVPSAPITRSGANDA